MNTRATVVCGGLLVGLAGCAHATPPRESARECPDLSDPYDRKTEALKHPFDGCWNDSPTEEAEPLVRDEGAVEGAASRTGFAFGSGADRVSYVWQPIDANTVPAWFND